MSQEVREEAPKPAASMGKKKEHGLLKLHIVSFLLT